jgi:arsenate reductase
MAEGFLRSFDGTVFVASAGTKPAERVHPLAVQVMNEVGIDISSGRPKDVSEFHSDSFDYVITLCDHARETCPVFAGEVRHHLHVGFVDPGEATGSHDEVLGAFRRVRDDMRNRLRSLLATIRQEQEMAG